MKTELKAFHRKIKKLSLILLYSRLKYYYLKLTQQLPDSIFFFTFHKTASTLFSNFLFNNIAELRSVNYANKIYHNRRFIPINFMEKGHIYGPIRLSSPNESEVYKQVISKVLEPSFINNKATIMFIRDPRDILVSSYFSFRKTHGFSINPNISSRQFAFRNEIKNLSIDEFALWHADRTKDHFKLAQLLINSSKNCVVLKYEDMIHDWEYFSNSLTDIISIDRKVLKKLYKKSRPKTTENQSTHKRSGQTGQFREKLNPATIDKLNYKLNQALNFFRYEK